MRRLQHTVTHSNYFPTSATIIYMYDIHMCDMTHSYVWHDRCYQIWADDLTINDSRRTVDRWLEYNNEIGRRRFVVSTLPRRVFNKKESISKNVKVWCVKLRPYKSDQKDQADYPRSKKRGAEILSGCHLCEADVVNVCICIWGARRGGGEEVVHTLSNLFMQEYWAWTISTFGKPAQNSRKHAVRRASTSQKQIVGEAAKIHT